MLSMCSISYIDLGTNRWAEQNALWSFYSNEELGSFPLLSSLTLLWTCLFNARQILRLEGKIKINDTDVMEKVTFELNVKV